MTPDSTPQGTVKLDPEALRARTRALKANGVTYSHIANRASVAVASLSTFIGGGRWGATLMGRLASALDAVEAERAVVAQQAALASPDPSPTGDTVPAPPAGLVTQEADDPDCPPTLKPVGSSTLPS